MYVNKNEIFAYILKSIIIIKPSIEKHTQRMTTKKSIRITMHWLRGRARPHIISSLLCLHSYESFTFILL